ncbi:MAG TPA: hypothetical protein VNL15_02045 [Dehalococcoidia bacterium]|nr:hypothetical protein [Dehalococcoidia bacterium]
MNAKYTRLYSGDDGESHFEDVSVEQGGVPPPEAARTVSFRVSEPGKVEDWHNSPYRHYVITLSGEAEIEVGDGTTRRFGPGDIILGEDLTGRGHVTRIGNGQPRIVMVVELADR